MGHSRVAQVRCNQSLAPLPNTSSHLFYRSKFLPRTAGPISGPTRRHSCSSGLWQRSRCCNPRSHWPFWPSDLRALRSQEVAWSGPISRILLPRPSKWRPSKQVLICLPSVCDSY